MTKEPEKTSNGVLVLAVLLAILWVSLDLIKKFFGLPIALVISIFLAILFFAGSKFRS